MRQSAMIAYVIDPIDEALRTWSNGMRDRPREIRIATAWGPLRVASTPEVSRTTWTLPMEVRGVDIALHQRRLAILGFHWLWPRRRWSRHAGLLVTGTPVAFARALAEHADVGRVLATWRAFELEVRDAGVSLAVPTTNVERAEAAVGARVTIAVAGALASV
jgi:hypothetical protein